MPLRDNPLLHTDSYKTSHAQQYPPGTTKLFSYIESRGGVFDRTVFFGLQATIADYVDVTITKEHVEQAADLYQRHGVPFPKADWSYLVAEKGGRLPLKIRAVPEGSVVPTHNALVTIESTDDRLPWVVSWLETALMRGVWYGTTVATKSWHAKKAILDALRKSSDDAAGQIPFKLHDFGARGAASGDAAALGGAAHLVNFLGTDTVEALALCADLYGEPMAGFSIPAAEHSTITSWGRDREVDAYANMLKQFAKPGAIVACVSDSYDLWNAVDVLWGQQLRQAVIDSGATVVIRPDSGVPQEIVPEVLKRLDAKFGHTVNGKGFRVLKNVRVIQGDGITGVDAIERILKVVLEAGYSADNLAFGMGGGLLQKHDRDTQKFAQKCSAALINGQWVDVYKDPITDPGKTSKKGRLDLVRVDGQYQTVQIGAAPAPRWDSVMHTVFDEGQVTQRDTLAAIRERANHALG